MGKSGAAAELVQYPVPDEKEHWRDATVCVYVPEAPQLVDPLVNVVLTFPHEKVPVDSTGVFP